MLRSDFDLFNRNFAPPCILAHAFGPTETLTTCWVLLPHGATVAQGKLPIGRALPGKDVLLLDEHGREVADGEVGEIVVRSRYISPGYWRDPERTSKAFVPDPAGSDARMYLTGDLGRRLPDGNLLHVGRRDFEVKIRGYRVDVSEIELALRDIEGIADAVVVGREETPGVQRLVAYYVSTTTPPVTARTARRHLAGALPDYMMPAAFVALPALPQTPNGKTDRLRLPAPTYGREDAREIFVSPRTALEAELAKIWADVLGITDVSVDDEFLELGGDSLQAARIVARVSAAFGIELAVPSVFGAPTVATMAEVVAASPKSEAVPGA
jgi:acyl-coenzyme A synthetase/AMP-(fatty) acid ligase/acyl carrier protein